ncbi:hypothetical protein DITRI_Ditri09bG0062600 [Diplodiscus trichospermus]
MLSNLKRLNLASNNLGGSIPNQLEKFLNLIELNLKRNQIDESIPQTISNIYALGSLDLSQNRLTGEIPSQLGRLQRLERLNLSHNMLSGLFPSGFDDCCCIGSGGYGKVYKGVLPTGRVVAVKKLHQSEDRMLINMKAFESEIRALANIRHRNIVKLYGFCSNSEHSFLVYEFVERGSLRMVLRSEETAMELDWNKRMNAVKGLANALSYMHHDYSPPIIHRDISSNNVLLPYQKKYLT